MCAFALHPTKMLQSSKLVSYLQILNVENISLNLSSASHKSFFFVMSLLFSPRQFLHKSKAELLEHVHHLKNVFCYLTKFVYFTGEF